MTTITVPSEVARALPESAGRFELRLSDGKLLGTFIPAAGDDIDRSNWPPPLTEQELERILAEGPARTTEEVQASLKSL
jgi:hypothetical protein